MLAELTYRCPLHCTYCANPLNIGDYAAELTTVDWLRTLDQARALGVLQVHFSGGEPLLRPDLPELVGHARVIGLYSNLVTSAIPLSAGRLERLAEAGLDHVQLSIQDSEAVPADTIAGRPAHHRKLAAARLVTGLGLPLTINVVLHRSNVDRLEAIADLAAALGAERVELAHTQFYGWAWRNRGALAPTPEQVDAANRAAAKARARHGDRVEFVYVDADYYSARPKPCMSGWGSRQFVVAPNGDVLPCLSAAQLPGLAPPNVRDVGLSGIWYDSTAFNRFRGTEWMPEPCSTCALKEIDFGGCRCQAFQLTGDPAATDPACALSPDHHLVASGASTVDAVPRRPR
jgi:pyrroloquinoline quinone biosynthesis protein E